jgi:hypothetical protein
MHSVKVAHRHEERNFRQEIVPNPFGGVNTHLLETRPTSSVLSLLFVSPIVQRQGKEWKGTGWKGLGCWIQCVETKHGVRYRKF